MKLLYVVNIVIDPFCYYLTTETVTEISDGLNADNAAIKKNTSMSFLSFLSRSIKDSNFFIICITTFLSVEQICKRIWRPRLIGG